MPLYRYINYYIILYGTYLTTQLVKSTLHVELRCSYVEKVGISLTNITLWLLLTDFFPVVNQSIFWI